MELRQCQAGCISPSSDTLRTLFNELENLSDQCDWNDKEPVPVFSKEFIQQFLALFTPSQLLVETQTTSYSFVKDGVIK